jgi:hypothetical protein
MRAMLFLALLVPFSTLAVAADERAADRTAIELVVDALNNPSAAPSAIWAPGVNGPAERAKLTGGPLSEVFGGRLVPGPIEFPSVNTAVVHARQTQIALPTAPATGPHSISLRIMMKRVRAGWRITGISRG